MFYLKQFLVVLFYTFTKIAVLVPEYTAKTYTISCLVHSDRKRENWTNEKYVAILCVCVQNYLWCQVCVLPIYDDSACVLCDYAHVYFTFYVIVLIILMNAVNIFRRETYAKSYNK